MQAMGSPKISIIIPTFNAVSTLKSAIESVICQTYKAIELIIVDGASTDGTQKIIDNYKEHVSLMISEPDKGVYDAMNKGIRMATGEWLYFLGSDDELKDEQVVASIFGNVENLKNDVLYGNVHLKKTNTTYDGYFDLQKLSYRNICHQAIFIKRNVFDKIGYFNLDYKTLADYDNNIRWFTQKDIRKSFINIVVAIYSEGGMSNAYIDEKFLMKKPSILKKLTKESLDFSGHYHILGGIGVEFAHRNNFLKGYFYAALVAFKLRDFQYLRKIWNLRKASSN